MLEQYNKNISRDRKGKNAKAKDTVSAGYADDCLLLGPTHV